MQVEPTLPHKGSASSLKPHYERGGRGGVLSIRQKMAENENAKYHSASRESLQTENAVHF